MCNPLRVLTFSRGPKGWSLLLLHQHLRVTRPNCRSSCATFSDVNLLTPWRRLPGVGHLCLKVATWKPQNLGVLDDGWMDGTYSKVSFSCGYMWWFFVFMINYCYYYHSFFQYVKNTDWPNMCLCKCFNLGKNMWEVSISKFMTWSTVTQNDSTLTGCWSVNLMNLGLRKWQNLEPVTMCILTTVREGACFPSKHVKSYVRICWDIGNSSFCSALKLVVFVGWFYFMICFAKIKIQSSERTTWKSNPRSL